MRETCDVTPPRSPGSGECAAPQSAASSSESARDQPRLALPGMFGIGLGDIQVARCLRVRQQRFGARAVPGFGARREHPVGDEIDVRAVFAGAGQRAQHVGVFADVLVDREIAELARFESYS